MANEADLFTIGDPIELETRNEFYNKKYKSQVLDILSEKRFIVRGPIVKNLMIPIHKETKLSISYIKEGKGRFKFDASIINRSTEKIYKMEIERISPIVRIQERGFYRLPIGIKILKEHTEAEGDEIINVEERCITEDLSGGGLRLFSNYNHQLREIVLCKFQEELKMSIKGEVVRIEDSNNPEYAYSLGIKFVNLLRNERDTIIQYIFKKQRKLRKKGLM